MESRAMGHTICKHSKDKMGPMGPVSNDRVGEMVESAYHHLVTSQSKPI